MICPVFILLPEYFFEVPRRKSVLKFTRILIGISSWNIIKPKINRFIFVFKQVVFGILSIGFYFGLNNQG